MLDSIDDNLLTDQEVAKLAKVSPNTVKYWRQTGILPFVKVGKHPRIWLSEFHKVFRKPSPIASLEIGNNPVKCSPLRTLGRKHG